MKFYNIGVINYTLLASPITGASTSLTVASGTGNEFEAGPFVIALSTNRTLAALQGAEFIEVLSRSSDVFTLGDRDLYGQAATQDWSAGTQVLEVWQPAHFNRLKQSCLDLSRALCMVLSNVATGVKANGPSFDGLSVVQQDTPNMTVKVKVGVGFENYRLYSLEADYNTPTITAPVTNPRIDRVSANTITDKIIVTTGTESGSPSAPAVPANCIPLATIYLTVAMSTITTGDITDVRTLL